MRISDWSSDVCSSDLATGKGCVVDTSLFETAVSWVESQINNYLETGRQPVRHGAASAVLAPYQAFETSDRPICIAAGNSSEERRVGKECVSTCRSRGSPYP